MNYTVHANNARLLSIGLEYEWMGAHPEDYQKYFVFNSQNGEIIVPEDIFTPQGLAELAADTRNKRSALVTAHLKELKTLPDAADNPESIKDDLNACNKEAQLEDFHMTTTGIVFHKASCLPHVIASLEPNLDITYSFQQLHARLSAFGQKLLSPAPQDISKDSFPSLAKPLRGKIDNKYNIVLQLHVYSDHSAGGFYYYNNYQSAIELSGTMENGVAALKERDKDGNETAVFNGTIKGTTLSGTWTNVKTKKTWVFEVKN
jgi:hypothetical protein